MLEHIVSMDTIKKYKFVDEELVPILDYIENGTIDKDLFTNEAHYLLFKSIRYKNIESILVSRRYIGITVVTVTKHYRHLGDRKHYRYYIIGISDSKLFVNEVSVASLDSHYINSFVIQTRDNRRIDCFTTDDYYFYSIFGYSKDLEASNIISLVGNDTYRVQGDILFRVNDYDEDIRYTVATNPTLQSELSRILTLIIYRRIVNILASYGISATIEGNTCTTSCIPFSVSKKHLYFNKLSSIIRDNLYIRDLIPFSLELDESESIRANPLYANYVMFILKDNEDPARYVRVFILNEPIFGLRFEFTRISVDISPLIITSIAERLLSGITIDKRRNKVDTGRHVIEYYGYPRSITVNFTLDLVEGSQDYRITAYIDELIVSENSTLTITHPEHGIRKYTVPRPISITFFNTQVHRDFESKISYYALRSMVMKDPEYNRRDSLEEDN